MSAYSIPMLRHLSSGVVIRRHPQFQRSSPLKPLGQSKPNFMWSILKLVSHWHANSSRLLREFSRGTFTRHSCECRENFHVSRTSHELVAKVLNMFKNWMRIFFPKYFSRRSHDGRATFVRMSQTCRREILAIYNAKLSRHSYECRASVARRSRDSLETTCEKLATIWRENKT